VTFHDPCGFGSKQVYQPCAKVTTKCISTFGNKYVSQPCANFTTKCISAFSTCDEASVRLPPSSAKHFAFLRQMQKNIFKKLETNKRKTRILPFLEHLAAIQARRVLSSLARTRKWTRCKVFAWYCLYLPSARWKRYCTTRTRTCSSTGRMSWDSRSRWKQERTARDEKIAPTTRTITLKTNIA